MQNRTKISDWQYFIIDRTQKENILRLMIKETKISSYPYKLSEFIVPGTLQSNIVRSEGLDPYYEKNMNNFLKYENMFLVLLSEVHIEQCDDRNILLFDFIDTVGDIYINGHLIKQTNCAHMIIYVDLPSQYLKKGVNQIFVIIYPPIPAFLNSDYEEPFNERVIFRKPPFNYGWDFAPRSLTKGIGSVILARKEIIEISDIFTYTLDIQKEKCSQFLEWGVKSEVTRESLFLVQIFDTENNEICYSDESTYLIRRGDNKYETKLVIDSPKLWWPNGYGQQPLYCLKLTIKRENVHRELLFGVRVVKLVLNQGKENRFTFEINHQMIFAKGANWVPTDALLNFSEEGKYSKLLHIAKNANFNMLRIWGGGVVERNIFYELCDSLGIMIWHDFQFACSIYPETEDYLALVELEIQQIILRLRNHPSIVLWCGNNENEWIDYQKISIPERKEKKIGDKLHSLKKRLCSNLDPSRPFWRSSPWSPSSENDYTFDPNSQDEGNSHNWEVWHGVNQPNLKSPTYDHYGKFKSKFVSEFGIQSLPSNYTISKIFNESTQSSPNETWKFHNCVLDKINVNMEKFGTPKDINEWILFSQTAQAFAMKFAIEFWRSQKFNTSGSLIWQFNEPWPTICWSLVDYYDIPKVAYWYTKNAYSPLLITYNKNEKTIVIVNDTLKSIVGTLSVSRIVLPGKINHYINDELFIEPNNIKMIKFPFNGNIEDNIIVFDFKSSKGKYRNYIFLTDPVNLRLDKPEVKFQVNTDESTITFISNVFTFLVSISWDLHPQDNCFNLLPNEPYTVKVENLPEENSNFFSSWTDNRIS
ncbi:MAG: glycoside hydrolase family 2 protein [Candidatus Hodarchaeales archaeon]|jgi:beta-mannosidase